MRNGRLLQMLSVATAVFGLAVGAAQAELLKLTAQLGGQNEVPPNDSAGSGSAEATLDTQTGVLTYSIVFEGLTGPVIGAHLHGPSDEGGNAGIVVPFETRESPIEGSAQLSPVQITEVAQGLTYVNIHTGQHPGGELRGQLR
ncbi:MAG: CHRD domain-containing protein [Rhizobiaceae bacterium]|nr:CHRD domain-containing protein [Rhizobiaceae bacterium]